MFYINEESVLGLYTRPVCLSHILIGRIPKQAFYAVNIHGKAHPFRQQMTTRKRKAHNIKCSEAVSLLMEIMVGLIGL